MTVIRHKHKRNFTVVPNAIMRDQRLSTEAKGVLIYMLSCPRGWEFYHWQIQQELGIGKQKLQRVIQELVEAGYLKRGHKQPRDSANRFAGYGYVVCDIPGERLLVPSEETPQRVTRRRKHDRNIKKEASSTELSNSHPNPLSRDAGPLLVGEQFTDFGLAARDAGMTFVYEGSKPYSAWQEFRGDDGLPLTDVVIKDGVKQRGIWMVSLYPPKRQNRLTNESLRTTKEL
jgi:hypothetical protein